MGFLLSILGWIAPGGFDKLANGVLTYLTKKTDAQLDGFKAGSQADTERMKALLDAHVEMSRLKAERNTWWGAKLIVLVAGLPCAVHFAAIMLDSTFRFNWGIAKVPAPYDQYEWAIVQSFFLVLPAMPLVSAAAAWMRRAR